jgi:hypothetical protein
MTKSTRGATILVSALLVISTVAAPVSAGPLDAVLRASISVTRSFDATYTVSDTALGASYTIAGTATGAQLDVVAAGTVLGACTDWFANPATCSTPGGFDPDVAAGLFDLTWTGIVGSSGNFARACVVVSRFFICSPGST